MKKITIIILVVIFAFSTINMFVGCKTEKEDVYEIILVDDDMNEIGKGDIADRTYSFEYDGEPKIFNAISLKNGERFGTPLFPKNEELRWRSNVSVGVMKGSQALSLQIQKGRYTLHYRFNRDNNDNYQLSRYFMLNYSVIVDIEII